MELGFLNDNDFVKHNDIYTLFHIRDDGSHVLFALFDNQDSAMEAVKKLKSKMEKIGYDCSIISENEYRYSFELICKKKTNNGTSVLGYVAELSTVLTAG